MARIELTREIVFAAGQDAANQQMRRAGRITWNYQDKRLAEDTQNNLTAYTINDNMLDAWVQCALITQAHADKVRAWQKAQE